MRHENLWLFASMLVLTFSVEASAQPSVQVDVPVLTLQAAVTLALRQNDRLLTVNENVDRANLSVNLARSAFAPKVVPNILGSFGQTNISNQTYNVDASKRFASGTELRSTIGASTFQNQLGNFTNTDTTFMISQPILRGFGRAVGRRSLDRAEFQAGDAVRQQLLAEQQVAVEVASAYYRVVAQREMVEVAQRALGSSRSLLAASTAKLRAGLVSRLDVLRAQQLVAEAEIQLFDAQAAVEDAMDQLRLLFGRGLEYQFVVTQGIPSDVRPIPPEIAVERAREHRIDLRSAEARLGIRSAARRATKGIEVAFSGASIPSPARLKLLATACLTPTKSTRRSESPACRKISSTSAFRREAYKRPPPSFSSVPVTTSSFHRGRITRQLTTTKSNAC